MIRKGDFNMASRKFRFVSPGVFLKEIDNSQIPRTPEGVGPVIIGRTRKGPAMKPYKVRSFEEFERVFGAPMPGNQGEDPWRDGPGALAESYLPYAAKAYLSADIDSPVTVIRLAGVTGDDATVAGEPGWDVENAWGLFLAPSFSGSYEGAHTGSALAAGTRPVSLGAIFYGADSSFEVKLKGTKTEARKATATIEFTGDPGLNNTITITSADGTALTYSAKTSANAAARTFDHNNTPELAAETLKNAILNGTPNDGGHGGKIAAVRDGAKVILTQAAGGTDGNTAITSNLQNVTISQNAGVPGFSGGRASMTTTAGSANEGVKQNNGKFKIVLKSSVGTKDVEFAFADIRKKFNTNPVMTNMDVSRVVSGTLSEHYWLGESFEETYKRLASLSGSHGDGVIGFTARLSPLMEDHKSSAHELRAARTGWIFASDSGAPGSYSPANQQKLFRIIALHEGLDASKSLIISIEKIRPPRVGSRSEFGTFDVIVKQILPTRVVKVEQFLNCSLDPSSPDYIARKIGDVYMEWDPIEKRNRTYGNNVNLSEFIRVEMDTEVDEGKLLNKGEVPFGFYGPIVPKTLIVSGTLGQFDFGSTQWISASGEVNLETPDPSKRNFNRVKLSWPSVPVVVTASTSDGSTGGYMFGGTPYEQTYSNHNGSPDDTINKGYIDYLRAFSDFGTLLADQKTGIPGTNSQYSFKFSLDDVVLTPRPGKAVGAIEGAGDVASALWSSGSRKADQSWSALADAGTVELRTMLNIVDGFHVPLAGGNDGVNITEANPFNMRVVDSSATTANSYAYASIDRAIELIRDPEIVEHNLALMPGVTNTKLTTKLIRTCEERADSLAIIDLPDVYIPPSQQKCNSFKDRVDKVTPERSAKNLVARQINSSYGTAYYPWVKIKDEHFDRDVWVPPSVVALGVMAYTEERDEVWFAPAGFNRGGLNNGNAGLPVLQASEQLLSKDRDTLYAANINPVAQFVSEGLVIFGQKTLQADQSALDRINVRRLLIFVKKEISRISNELLFEQNVQATWSRFSNQAVSFLKSVRTRFGLSDFKVILDETTTTPDLVDRNIMYAKILLKPARSIEFIAVDFVITNTGASFED